MYVLNEEPPTEIVLTITESGEIQKLDISDS